MLKIRCKQEVQKHVVWGIRQLMWSWAVISTPMPEKSPASLSLNYIWKKEGWFRKVKDQFMKYKTLCLLCGTKYIPSNEDCLCTNRTGCNFRWLDTLPGMAGSHFLCRVSKTVWTQSTSDHLPWWGPTSSWWAILSLIFAHARSSTKALLY